MDLRNEPKTQFYGEDHFILLEEFEVKLSDNETIVIPAGFISDFASVHKKLRWLISPTEAGIRRAALTHDWLYAVHLGKSRKEIDAIFEKIMREDRFPRAKSKLCFLAVHYGGKSHYLSGPKRLAEKSPQLSKFIGTTPEFE